MTDNRKKKAILRLIFILAIIFIITGLLSSKYFIKHDNIVLATNVEQAVHIMGERNPVLIFFEQKIKNIEEQIRIEQERIAEEQRIAEEKRLEEERKKQEEEEEKKKNMGKAYLTFDDGPSKVVTPQILEILKRYNIKATFFVVGKMVDTYPEILKKTHEAGHSIGNHSYSHSYNYIYKNTNNFMEEINATNQAIENALGKPFKSDLLRFPGGSFDAYKKPFRELAEKEGYDVYDWNALNGDAEGKSLTKQQLIARLKETTKGKKKVIILMHDTDAKQTTADSLAEIIEYLISQNYYFEPLSETKGD